MVRFLVACGGFLTGVSLSFMGCPACPVGIPPAPATYRIIEAPQPYLVDGTIEIVPPLVADERSTFVIRYPKDGVLVEVEYE